MAKVAQGEQVAELEQQKDVLVSADCSQQQVKGRNRGKGKGKENMDK